MIVQLCRSTRGRDRSVYRHAAGISTLRKPGPAHCRSATRERRKISRQL
ncbi:hypothetical protein EKH55_2002 [Sinorhizobium alkalisoli]|nr:hypothetical protein EKH55_2002 [Sinorhizobium alkalisoli]